MSEKNTSKQPSFILDQEIKTKSGQVITQRFGVMFEREDGRHNIKLDAMPLGGELVASTPAQRLERLKQKPERSAEPEKDVEKDIER